YDITISKEELAPDGFTREMYTINGQFPGPLIEVNKGDTLVLNVHNDLEDETTIHSHGMFQRGTPWYDGVPGQTQRGIPPKKSFTYEFKVDQSGTYCHSHSNAQYIEGVVGALIAHDPDDPYLEDYDEEIVVLLQDWYHKDSKILLSEFMNPANVNGSEPTPDNGLINGKNSYNCSWAPAGKYWMRSEMETACLATESDKLNPLVKAIVEYEGHDIDDDPKSVAWTETPETCVDLDSSNLKPYNEQKVPDVDYKLIVDVNFHPDDKGIVRGYINNSTYLLDAKYPTLHKVFDNVKEYPADQNAYLIENNKVVDIILSNYNYLNFKDPIQRDTVTVPPDGCVKFVNLNLSTFVLIILKIFNFATRWTILRFVSDNPGVWGFHCHIEWHVQSGLVMQFIAQPDKIRELKAPDEWAQL
ncbi:11941_t:CDS:2, partial [Racocetra fulgida]